jgi:thiamine biosynthesis lipoprotein
MKAMRPLLGTFVEIEVKSTSQHRASAALDAAFSAMEKVQSLMSLYEPNSDISRISRCAHIAPQYVHPWTAQVLAIAIDLHERSAGLFDCAVAPHLADWGLLPQGEDAPQSSLRHVQLDEMQVSAALPVRLDLGGIAKGFAVDCAIDAIRAQGVTDASINAGGDLRVMGSYEEAIHLRDPADPQVLHFAGMLKDGAIATSATYYSRHEHEGREVSALVDPRNGSPIITRNSYSVIAPLCCHADALTKVLAITEDPTHPCFAHYDAATVILRAQ